MTITFTAKIHMDIDILIFWEITQLPKWKLTNGMPLIKDLFSVITWHLIELDISCSIYFWQLESNAIEVLVLLCLFFSLWERYSKEISLKCIIEIQSMEDRNSSNLAVLCWFSYFVTYLGGGGDFLTIIRTIGRNGHNLNQSLGSENLKMTGYRIITK